MTHFTDIRIFLCMTPTNMNYSFDGLMGQAQRVFEQDPCSGHLFLFLNRNRDRIKILFWDQDGFCIFVREFHRPLVGAHSDVGERDAVRQPAGWPQDDQAATPQRVLELLYSNSHRVLRYRCAHQVIAFLISRRSPPMVNRNGRRQNRDPLPGDASDPAGLSALLERFLLWKETHHYATGTVTLRRQILARFVRCCLERSVTRPCDVTPLMIERYQRHLFHYRKRNGQPLSLTTQSQALTSLRRWFWWMHHQHHLEHNPTADMQLPRGERRLPRHAMSEGEVEAVLAQADITTPLGLRNRAMLETLYSTGLRREEVLSLQLTDIDRQRSLLLVRCGKGKKDRYVPVGQRALAWIDKYLADVRPQLQGSATSPALFLTKNGRAMHPNYFSALVRKYLENAGVAKAGACHLFRHATATLMLENGADVRFIQALLGHESLRTTQIYTHVSISRLREVHERTHPARLSRLQGSEDTEQDGTATAEGG